MATCRTRCWTLVVALLASGCNPSPSDDPVVLVAEDDAEMDQAIADARARLSEFWTLHENTPAGVSDLSLKVEISDASGTEFFWAGDIQKRDGKIFGTINNDPNIVKSVKLGQEIEIPEDKIADWMYVKDEKMHGNFTMGPLLKTLPKEQADELRSRWVQP